MNPSTADLTALAFFLWKKGFEVKYVNKDTYEVEIARLVDDTLYVSPLIFYVDGACIYRVRGRGLCPSTWTAQKLPGVLNDLRAVEKPHSFVTTQILVTKQDPQLTSLESKINHWLPNGFEDKKGLEWECFPGLNIIEELEVNPESYIGMQLVFQLCQ